ncbi:(Fe-S)-binding protein [Pseudodesulfovibrio sp. zrk46]|nr:(Fe-S)-binding protein [Pseudodesulfovibrio sp. zrk46]
MTSDCILCGKCLEVCPLINATQREELGPRAKAELYAMLSEDESLLVAEDAARLASLCLGCHRCKKVCSKGVDVPGLVAALRGAHPNFKSWLWKTWLTNAKSLWGKSATAAKLIPEEFRPDKFGPFLKMLAGLKGGPGLTPFLQPDSFPDTYRGEKMLLFAGCTANYVQGRWLMTALRLLDGLGVEVLPGDFQCCGGGLKGAGFAEEAGVMAKHNVDVWRKAGKPKVVTFCASCRSSLTGYDQFRDEAERGDWAESLVPLSSLLQDVVVSASNDAPESLGYHRPCHVDAMDSDYTFLKAALDDRLTVDTRKECCGFGGLMKLGAPELSTKVNTVCWDRLAGAEIVVTGCSACATQLAATAPENVSVGHWLELLQ